MKVAISIPDKLFHEAETVAEDLGLTRSGLYGRAIAEFLYRHRGQIITDKLNEVYGTEPATSDPVLAELQWRVIQRELGQDDWSDRDRSDGHRSDLDRGRS